MSSAGATTRDAQGPSVPDPGPATRDGWEALSEPHSEPTEWQRYLDRTYNTPYGSRS